jgi:hypothetical protein
MYTAVLILITAVYMKSYPYSLDAFNGMVGNGVISIQPELSYPISPQSSIFIDPIGAYGFTDHFDVFADVAEINLSPAFGYNNSWVMPRFEFLPGNIAGLQIGFNNTQPLSYDISPQYHFFYENDSLAFEFNALATIPINYSGSSNALSAIIAPVWKCIKNIIHPFVEIDPTYAFDGSYSGLHLNIVPGIWFGIPDTPHQFCLALTLSDVTRNFSYGVNFSYSVAIPTIPDTNK